MSHEDENKPEVNRSDVQSDKAATLDERLQAHIGSQLKSMYDSYLNEPIPDRIVELLEKLDGVSKTGGSGGGQGD